MASCCIYPGAVNTVSFFLIALAKNQSQTYISLRDLSHQKHLPYRFLSQIATDLKKCGMVGSKEGAGGGYFLLKKPEHIKTLTFVKEILATGENITRITHVSGNKVDIKVHPPHQWGSILQHYTGSKLHNIHLRTLAQKQGRSLSEYGIKTGKTCKTFTDEMRFYKALGLEYIPPELREDTGEIEAALAKHLPALVTGADIKGDLHVHTNIDIQNSHDLGGSSVADILRQAQRLGYEYIGLSDHNPKLTKLSPEQRLNLVTIRNHLIDTAVAKFNASSARPIKVLKGLEIDISPDGSLALEDKAIDLLDYAIASVHSQFEQPREIATKRVLTALAHPKIRIFGHPTGRIILRRPGLEYDWDKIFAFCKQHQKFLEINASPDRLDLPDSLVHQAIRHGIQVVINTDSHHADGLRSMQYGVWNARRGWSEKQDVVNTLPWTKLKTILHMITLRKRHKNLKREK